MKRILFVHKSFSRFVETDLALLRNRYQVEEWFQRGRSVNLWQLARAVMRNDLVFGWFASWHTFLPTLLGRLFARPVLLVVGGYDVSDMPEYGHQSRHSVKKWVGGTTMRLAARAVAFSNFSRRQAIENAAQDPAKVVTSYLGVANVQYRLQNKTSLVVTAGNVNHSNLSRKGHEAFVRAAGLAPELQFVLIGETQERDAAAYLKSIAPANVRLTGRVTDDELVELFSQAKVYVQASLHEGFGLAVAEAMLCECVPVVTRAGSLPEVVGDAGIYLSSAAPDAIAQGVRLGVCEQPSIGPAARRRVQKEFPPERRARELYAIIDSLV